MKYFEAIIGYVALIGIHPLGPNETSRFNARNIAVFLIFMVFIVASTAFIVFDVDTFSGYTISFFWWISVLLTSVGFFVNILKSPKLFGVVVEIEKLVNSRKLKTNTLQAK